MTTNIYEGRLEQMHAKIRKQWDLISDADLEKVNGYQEQLIGVLQKKYGYTHAAAEVLLESFGLCENSVLEKFSVSLKGETIPWFKSYKNKTLAPYN